MIKAGRYQWSNVQTQWLYYKFTNLYVSLWFGFVIELLLDEAAQTQNPYVILIPYYVAFYTWLGFFIHAFPFE